MKPAAVLVWSAAALLAVSIFLAAFAFARYPGSGFVFLIFNLCFFALAALAFPQPRLYVYTFLAAFLVLGFWLKVVIHAIWAPGFIEPIGDFANTPQEWDGALNGASCAALGIITARCGHLWLWWNERGDGESAGAAAPGWFVRWRRPIWLLTIAFVIAVNGANLYFAFFQIGVNPRLILPMRIHVVLAWLVNVGFAFWVAALLWWDYRADRTTLGRDLVMPLVESFLSSVSAFSRLIYLLHTAPYWLVLLERRKGLADALQRRWLGVLAGGFVLLFVCSILAVFWLREHRYYAPSDQNLPHTINKQLPNLFIHRWVGLEGLLAVGAVANRGPQLLFAAVTDDPRLASLSVYQRIAKVRYLSEDPEKFTFLGNAGPAAILLFSGSLSVVFIGMGLIGVVLILTEETARRWTGNPFLVAVAGTALANVISQTTFFYLTSIFLLQLWLALGFVGAIQRLRVGEPATRADFNDRPEGQ